jgi:hypothetical protein
MKRQRLTAIITHIRPHLEELLATYCFLSDHFSDQVGNRYSYVSRAKVLFWDDLPEGTTREQLEEEGNVLIGRWGGKFDEHSTLSEPRKIGESAVTLVAAGLGICQEERIQKLLQLTSARDQKLGESMCELPAVLKMMNDFNWSPDVIWPWVVTAFEAFYSRGNEHFSTIAPEAGAFWGIIVDEWIAARFGDKASAYAPSLKGILDFAQKVRAKVCGTPFEPHAVAFAIRGEGTLLGEASAKDWGFAALDVMYQQAHDFNAVAAMDFKRAKKFHITIKGKKAVIVVGESNSLQFSRYARSSKAEFDRAAIVIAKNSAGNVTISSDVQRKFDFSRVVASLRAQELRAKGKPVPTDQALLYGENAIPDCEEWYYFEKGGMILNGSTTKSRPATHLPVAQIYATVFVGVGAQAKQRS